jgi:predicted nucleotidyltransferase
MRSTFSDFPSLPPIFQRAIQKAKTTIPKAYPDTLCLVLIGSVAEGDFKTDSDVDIVWVKSRKLGFQKLYEFERSLGERTQLVLFNRKGLEEHFTKSTTMAHAIKNGIVLYTHGNSITRILDQEITVPDREWMKGWFEHWTRFYRMGLRDIRRNRGWHKRFCQKRCVCEVSDCLARATVNFAILFSELHGSVPTTKVKVLKGFRTFGRTDLISGLRIALRVSRQKRPMSRKEAETVKRTAKWLRDTLARRLRS